MYENLCKKYGITKEEVKKAVDIVSKNLRKIVNPMVMIAVADLLAAGDVKEDTQ